MHTQTTGWALFALIVSSGVITTLAYPNQQMMETGFVPARGPQLPAQRIERKFAEKPNAIKKVALDDLDDIQTNQIQEGGGGFSWSNILGELGSHVGADDVSSKWYEWMVKTEFLSKWVVLNHEEKTSVTYCLKNL